MPSITMTTSATLERWMPAMRPTAPISASVPREPTRPAKCRPSATSEPNATPTKIVGMKSPPGSAGVPKVSAMSGKKTSTVSSRAAGENASGSSSICLIESSRLPNQSVASSW